MVRALKRQSDSIKFSPKGKKADEILSLVGKMALTVSGCTVVGAEIGSLLGNPVAGAAIGFITGSVICLGVMIWYLFIRYNPDGTITAIYTPVTT